MTTPAKINILCLVDEPKHAGAVFRCSSPMGALVDAGVARVAVHKWPGVAPADADDPKYDEILAAAGKQEVKFPPEFIRDLAGADVVFMPQTAISFWHTYIRFWQAKGKVCVLDADDDSFNVHPMSPSYAVRGTDECAVRVNGKIHTLWEDIDKHRGEDAEELKARSPQVLLMHLKRNRQLMNLYKKAMLEADGITTTTERAKERFSDYNTNVFVCPNSVDTELYKPGRHPAREGFRVLWFGGNSHQGDMRLAGLAMGDFARAHPDVVVVVCGSVVSSIEQAVPENQREFYDWTCMEAHPWRLQCMGADLGVCAVEPGTKFNACKSALKWTELGAVGVPSICTDTPPYSDAVKHGEDGWLVPDTRAAWLEAFERFYADTALRTRIAGGARARMVKDYDLFCNAGKWYGVFRSLVDAKRRDTGAPSLTEQGASAEKAEG